ncbi:hypothetical protein N644_0790 [Lactiplantibacillus paraplantarum]|nr:hypothetical protein N644_0790 [Lactiplantibacillus paraplantarum]
MVSPNENKFSEIKLASKNLFLFGTGSQKLCQPDRAYQAIVVVIS